MPPPSAQEFAARQFELARVEDRLAALRQAYPGLGLPITLIAAGSFGAMYFSVTAAELGGGSHVTESERARQVALAAAAALSAGAAGGGLVWLLRRVHIRRQLKPEIRELRERRRVLRESVGYGFNTNGQQYGIAIHGRF